MKTIKNILFGLLVVIATGIIACGGVSSSGGGGGSDEPPNYVPQNVTAEASYFDITIRWDSVAGASSYNIYWGLDDTVSKTNNSGQFANVTSPYVDSVPEVKIYYYVVTSVTGQGESDDSLVVNAESYNDPPPPPPPGP